MDHTDALTAVCALLAEGDLGLASSTLRREYPFVAHPMITRAYSEQDATRVFIRDGFLDRYSGDRLVFPGVLRVLSLRLPVEFPFHRNWKMSETHPAYWELTPTVDHIVPVTRGGADTEANWVTTSMLRNSAKGNWTIDELGWTLRAPGNLRNWDGLLAWFRSYLRLHPDVLGNAHVRRWHRALATIPMV